MSEIYYTMLITILVSTIVCLIGHIKEGDTIKEALEALKFFLIPILGSIAIIYFIL